MAHEAERCRRLLTMQLTCRSVDPFVRSASRGIARCSWELAHGQSNMFHGSLRQFPSGIAAICIWLPLSTIALEMQRDKALASRCCSCCGGLRSPAAPIRCQSCALRAQSNPRVCIGGVPVCHHLGMQSNACACGGSTASRWLPWLEQARLTALRFANDTAPGSPLGAPHAEYCIHLAVNPAASWPLLGVCSWALPHISQPFGGTCQ